MSETCQTCHSLCPPAVVESGECIWCIAEQFKRENTAMRDAIKEAHKIIDVLYMDALDHHKESWPRAREWMEKWKEVAK